MHNSTGRILKTTQTSLKVIDTIQNLNGATMDQIASELDLSKSTVHGHLSTLIDNHYLVEEDGEYNLGLAFFNHGEYVRSREESYGHARDKVISLAEEINEGVDFSVEEYGRTIVLYDESGNINKRGFQVGQHFYMNTNAAGKAILSEMSRERVEEILNYWGLPKETENTITNKAELYEELDQTQERGYATNEEENFLGIRAIGSTVHNPDGSILGAVSIYGPQYRLPPNEKLVDPLFEAIEELEHEIASS